MKYRDIRTGIFVKRPNRFIAMVEVDGEEVVCHVKNTGRCRELLVPGCQVYLEPSDKPERKTAYSVIAVKKDRRLINMDSQAPNHVVKEWLKAGNLFGPEAFIYSEKTFQNSRFDFYIESGKRQIYMEVKGVTLEENGVVRFPDAPTERGLRHVEELMDAVDAGYEAWILFVIQMEDVRYFTPNITTQPAFAAMLSRAKEHGVHIAAYECAVTEDTLEITTEVEVRLHELG